MSARSVTSPDVASRRSLLRAGLAGLAGLALGALGRPRPADAAPGGSIIMGSSNSAGTTNTALTTTSTGTAFQVVQAGTGTALRGVANNGIAGFFSSGLGAGVSGVTGNNTKYGVYAANDATAEGSGAALRANGKNNDGIVATSSGMQRFAIRAVNTFPTESTALLVGSSGFTGGEIDTGYLAAAAAFVGTSGINVLARDSGFYPDGFGVTALAEGSAGTALYAQELSDTGDVLGVHALTSSPTGMAVEGDSYSLTGTTYGVFGTCASSSATAAGVVGAASGAGANGVIGDAGGAGGVGVVGLATQSGAAEKGVYGAALASSGVAYGVYGRSYSTAGYGVYSYGQAYVNGALQVTGSLTKGGGSFKIDHPLDPANKYLYHSFVESPDMKNVYDGVVTLDAKGEATVELPDWFEALNRDLRYQLTPIGRSVEPLYVNSELEAGRFAIAGGKAGQRVCWQVTGIRKDAWAEAHRIPIEEAKVGVDRGRFLHPAEHGQPDSKGIEAIRDRGEQRATVAARRAARRGR